MRLNFIFISFPNKSWSHFKTFICTGGISLSDTHAFDETFMDDVFDDQIKEKPWSIVMQDGIKKKYNALTIFLCKVANVLNFWDK